MLPDRLDELDRLAGIQIGEHAANGAKTTESHLCEFREPYVTGRRKGGIDR